MYPISMIPYCNMEPYRILGEPQDCRFVWHTPRQSTHALLEGQSLAACVPTGALPDLNPLVTPVRSLGIAANRAVRSVLLFSDRPFVEMDENTSIYLTNQSVSSVRLLFILLGYNVGLGHLPRITDQREKANGILLIGDAALRAVYGDAAEQHRSFPHVTDLASAWYKEHGLPFVFARWVVSREAPVAFVERLEQWLDRFETQEARLIAASIPTSAKQLELSEEQIESYFSGLHWVLKAEDRAAQELFLEQLNSLRGLSFAASWPLEQEHDEAVSP